LSPRPQGELTVDRMCVLAYLAVLLDAFSRRVIGWALDTHLRASLATAALGMAIKARRLTPAQIDPNAAFEWSSQPPSSRCCDDRLNPPNTPAANTPPCWRPMASSRA
jgi:transposase InsO family protein